MYGLVDANNFYCSVERSFNPTLEGKPVIVLSNRDGNVVARSNEAKELGIKMGVAFFETKELRQQHDIAVFSSNYTLYGETSSRLMSLLTQFVEDVEVYSIDEAFLQVDGYESLYPTYQGLGQAIRDTVKQCLRIPVSIGFGPTKTLAKLANRLAKQHPELGGVCILDNKGAVNEALAGFPVGDLWGVGRRYASKLKKNGIETAAQLRDAPDDWVAQVMTVNGLRLVYELRGVPCRMLDVSPLPKKTICTAPGFGTVIPDLNTINDALTTHLARACEKLRRQRSLCGTVTVFLHTNRFRKTPGNGQPAKAYYNSRTVELPHPTNSTAELLTYAQESLRSIFAFGYNYQKVGIILSDLVPADYRQKGVFVEGPDERWIKLGSVVDRLNGRYGRDKLRMASQQYNPDWPMKPQYLSPCYTTRWEDILTAQ
ncbi:Y-family DNA polymerase [Spirosoma utsteinense]|uniref:DNA polymerase V n=1 Tax=Spirosoma utsteinense TaxID=2585773 RepID=A0ABR6W901_9BACT|nr:Y-family DNA polymerase [Spirosoma utsteinense]MBC3789031.1 DNA polymerase V [Spirosoma utsteinense]MBC3792643.1 DNA polymerase V [Spirosoma utsteinense]